MTTQEKITVMQAEIEGREIEWLRIGDKNWQTTIRPVWNWQDGSYRIKPAPFRVPLTADDIPPLCWIGGPDRSGWLVISVNRETVLCGTNRWTFQQLMDQQQQYSTDRKTWLPCSKEAI